MADPQEGHSEEYFGPARDHWWNRDFLDLMAKRWALGRYSEMLDVGCGRCHWSRLIATYLRAPARITAVDQDSKWAAGDSAISAEFSKLDATVTFSHGDAHHLPFPDSSFDVVTCQTVLIHCAQPLTVLREMKRVARPGGIVICAEPNNLALFTSFSSLDLMSDVETLVDGFRERLLWERGKQAVGEGNTSLGDQLPMLFQQAGFTKVQHYLSDRVRPWIPPYTDAVQQANIHEAREHTTEDAMNRAYAKARRYISALGNPQYLTFLDHRRRQWPIESAAFLQALERNEYFASGLGVIYLVSGEVT